jgi:hypothetical protein
MEARKYFAQACTQGAHAIVNHAQFLEQLMALCSSQDSITHELTLISSLFLTHELMEEVLSILFTMKRGEKNIKVFAHELFIIASAIFARGKRMDTEQVMHSMLLHLTLENETTVKALTNCFAQLPNKQTHQESIIVFLQHILIRKASLTAVQRGYWRSAFVALASSIVTNTKQQIRLVEFVVRASRHKQQNIRLFAVECAWKLNLAKPNETLLHDIIFARTADSSAQIRIKSMLSILECLSQVKDKTPLIKIVEVTMEDVNSVCC